MTDHFNHATLASIVVSTVLCLSATPAYSACEDTALPDKLEIKRNTDNLDTAAFFSTIRSEFDRQFRGWAVIFTGNDGVRMGFYRRGWAVHPCDSDSNGGVPFDLNTETAIGSVTKLVTAVAALKVAPAGRLSRPFTDFLPDRWQAIAHPYYETVSVRHLLNHQAGFRKGGNGEHITDRLRHGPELSTGLGTRVYSNTGFGLFHFIHAKWTNSPQSSLFEGLHRSDSDDTYNREVQDMTSRIYNQEVYRLVTRPLKISATCNPNESRFPQDASIAEYFPFFPVARSHDGQFARRGTLLRDATRHCASGGLYMSAKDLATFMTALDDPAFLSPDRRAQMINNGQAADLLSFGAAGGATGGRAFWKNGGRHKQNGDSSVAGVIRFHSGAHAVFVANSPIPSGIHVRSTLVNAYNNARNPPGTSQGGQCVQQCRADRDVCMDDVATPGGAPPQVCVAGLNRCLADC